MLINLRNALMAGKRLPYDAEVEYLESTGTQWIDTGVLASQDIKIEARFYRAISPSQFAYGVRSGSTTISCATGTGTSVSTIGYARWGNSAYAAAITNTEVVVVQDKDGVTVNGTHYNYTATESVVSQSGYTIALFAAKNSATTVTANLSGKFWYCKIWNNGTLVRDFIPVRKGTVGYLYDRVSGKLFGNAGTGDFVLGPDVVPVEYIESTGTQYINLQVSVASGDSFTLNMTGLFTGTSSAMQLHGVNGGAYFGLQTNGNYTVGGQDTGVARDSADHAFALSATIGNSQVVSLGIDGNTYTRTRNNSAGYIGLFNLLDASTSNPLAYYSKFRMKDASIAVNGATVRTMKPIRVGSVSTWEGAMMDVLTRRIYRNQGTGAFSYGNDLKYPIPSE